MPSKKNVARGEREGVSSFSRRPKEKKNSHFLKKKKLEKKNSQKSETGVLRPRPLQLDQGRRRRPGFRHRLRRRGRGGARSARRAGELGRGAGDRRRARPVLRGMEPGDRHQPVGHLPAQPGLRAAAGGGRAPGADRQSGLDAWADGGAAAGRLYRVEAWRGRPDEADGDGIRPAGHPRECGGAGRGADAADRALLPGRRDGADHPRHPCARPLGGTGGDRRGDPVPSIGGMRLHDRQRAAGWTAGKRM